MFRKLILKEKGRDIAVAVVYLLFLVVVAYAFYNAPSPAAIPTYLLLLFFWAFGVLDEVLRRSYRAAYKYLTEDCDAERALGMLDTLDRRDFLKGYRVRSVLLRGLALIDKGQVKEAREQLLGEAKRLTRAADSRFSLCYLIFLCDAQQRDLPQLKETYKTLCQFFEAGLGRKQGVVPSSRKMLAGCFYLTLRQYDEAEEQLRTVPLDVLSNRDRAWYAILRAQIARHDKEPAAEQEWYEKATALAPCCAWVREYRLSETVGKGVTV